MVRKSLLFVMLVLLAILPTACAKENTAGASPQSPPPEQKTGQSSTPSPRPVVWDIDISDDANVKIGDYDVKVHMKMYGFKQGGEDPYGTYTGRAFIDYEMNLDKGEIKGNAKGEGRDDAVKMELVKFDQNAYAGYEPAKGKPFEYRHLAKEGMFDSMALGQINLSGKGNVEESVPGQDWKKNEEKTKTVTYRLVVSQKSVTIFVYDLFAGDYLRFQGTLERID